MKAVLQKHVFTRLGTGYRTVAKSKEIDLHLQRQLERRAERYIPSRTGDYPVIYRVFRTAEDGPYAVSLIRDADSGHGRIYVAHSYVIPDEVVDEVEHNLAWIAAQLPPPTPPKLSGSAGMDIIPPAAAEISGEDQYRLLPLVATELGIPALARLVTTLFQHLEEQDPDRTLLMHMPARPDDLEDILRRTIVADDRKAPVLSADQLRLLRFSSLLALLPRPYRRHVSDFSVNEAQAESVRGDGPAIAVSRVARAVEALPEAAFGPWLSCAAEGGALGSAGDIQFVELAKARQWVGKFMRRPAPGCLDQLAGLYKMIEKGASADLHEGVDFYGLQRNSAALVNTEELADLMLARLDDANMPPARCADFFVTLARLGPDMGRHGGLGGKIIEFIDAHAAKNPEAALQMFLALPPNFQRYVWAISQQSKRLPSTVATEGGAFRAADMSFALMAFRPSTWSVDPYHVMRIAERFVRMFRDAVVVAGPTADADAGLDPAASAHAVGIQDLVCRPEGVRMSGLVPTEGDTFRMLRRFFEVVGSAALDRALLEELARAFLSGMVGLEYIESRLRKLVVHFLNTPPGAPADTQFVIDFLARLVAVATPGSVSVARVVFQTQPGRSPERTLEWLESLRLLVGTQHARNMVAVQIEFIHLQESQNFAPTRNGRPSFSLTKYREWLAYEWQSQRRPFDVDGGGTSVAVAEFHAALANAIPGLSPQRALLIGLAYVRENTALLEELLPRLVARLRRDAPGFANSILKEEYAAVPGESAFSLRLLLELVDCVVVNGTERGVELLGSCLNTLIASQPLEQASDLVELLDRHRGDLNPFGRWPGLVKDLKQVLSRMRKEQRGTPET